MTKRALCGALCLAAVLALGPSGAWPAGDGSKPADMTKPVRVFILMGQSNMVGMGNVSGNKGETLEKAVKTEKLYPYLLDASGNWAERNDVRYVQVMVGRGAA
jgi:alpha-galactosidase